MAVDFLGLEWSRPWGATALFLVIVLILMARTRDRAEPQATGTLELWTLLDGLRTAAGRRPRRQLSAALVWLLLALVLGSLALSGPAPQRQASVRTWVVVLDRSPGAWLPVAPGAEQSRIERALESMEGWLASAAEEGDRVRWLTPERPPIELDLGERPPPEWLAADLWHAPRPDFGVRDLDGRLWVSDRGPSRPPVRAGLFLGGGAAVHGPVGSKLGWDGNALTALTSPPLRSLYSQGAPPRLERLLDAWMDSSGFSRALEREDAALIVEYAPAASGAPVAVMAGRDGWSALGRAPSGGLAAAAGSPGALTWLRSMGGEILLVDSAPGRVRFAWSELEEPEGDPAAFAVSWARLLDETCLPAPGAVPLEHRLAAGDARLVPPRAAPPALPPAGGGRSDFPLGSLLASGAGACALIALSLSAGRGLGRG